MERSDQGERFLLLIVGDEGDFGYGTNFLCILSYNKLSMKHLDMFFTIIYSFLFHFTC